MPALPKGEPRSQCELHICRIRLTFAQTCQRAAPSVTACAVPPSSERKAFALRAVQTCLSLWERCRAATERANTSQHVLKVYPDTNLSASCPLSHLLRKCQLSQRESREAGANWTPDESEKLWHRLACVLLLPSRLAPRHLPQGGRLWSYAQSLWESREAGAKHTRHLFTSA